MSENTVFESEDSFMPDVDSNEFGPSVLKNKFVRTGSSVEQESSRLQGRNGDDVSNVIVRDIHSEFSGFFGKTSGVSIDEFLDGAYNDETGGTLTIQWSANKKSAVCNSLYRNNRTLLWKNQNSISVKFHPPLYTADGFDPHQRYATDILLLCPTLTL